MIMGRFWSFSFQLSNPRYCSFDCPRSTCNLWFSIGPRFWIMRNFWATVFWIWKPYLQFTLLIQMLLQLRTNHQVCVFLGFSLLFCDSCDNYLPLWWVEFYPSRTILGWLCFVNNLNLIMTLELKQNSTLLRVDNCHKFHYACHNWSKAFLFCNS